MPAQRFLIGAYNKNSGQQTNVKPWIIPDEAFSELNNAYVFRGRVRKRFGSQLLSDDPLQSRLRINIGTITSGGFSGNVATILVDSGFPTAVGQAFSVGTVIFTVYNPASGAQNMLRSDNVSATATYDLSTSDFVIAGVVVPDATPVYIYPALPVMGLKNVETSLVDDNFIVGFDTRYAYQYSAGWDRLGLTTNAGDATWTGSNSQFFWTTTWTGATAADRIFFVTNFNQNEPNYMRYLIFATSTWTTFNPSIDGTNFIISGRIIVPFKNRLVILNTWEGTAGPGTNYVNRARYSQVGSPLDTNAFRSDMPGRGNFIDAATTETIVTVEFIKDRLIVYFDQSTWELVYTGNQAYPFTWQQINTELGAEATFSVVPFDKVVLGVGNVGIHACNGANVERIDDNIPDEVFAIHNGDSGPARVYGIRDYFVEMVYWTFPSTDASSDFPYPNRVLVYNYRNQSWAFNDDSITAFGYYQPSSGVTWDSTTVTWNDPVSWGSGSLQALFRSVIAGNQEGFTFICNPDVVTNAPALQITNITTTPSTQLTIIDHNFRVGDYIYIQGATYSDASNGLNNQIFQVTFVIDSNNFDIGFPAIFTGAYIGGGLVSRVSQISITTKEYNFFGEKGRNSYVSKVDFMVDATPAGQIQVNFFVSTSLAPLLQDSMDNGSIIGTGILETFAYTEANGVPSPVQFEEFATRLWHPVYFQADGEVVQFQLILNDTQMMDVDVMNSDFQMHAMCIYAEPTSSRFQ